MSTARHAGRTLLAWGFPAAVILATLVVAARSTSVSQTANHLVYDPFVHLDAKLNLVPTEVLLVYADDDLDERPDDYWQLVRRLRRLGAIGLGIVELDARVWSDDQLRRLARWKGLVVGELSVGSPSLPASVARGSIRLLQSPDGVHRRDAGSRAEPDRSSLAVQLAKSFGSESLCLPQGDFGVRFCGGAPHLTNSPSQ